MTKSNFIVFGKQKPYTPILASAAVKGVCAVGDVIDDGTPKDIILGQFDNEDRAERFMERVKLNTKKGQWKMWVEKK